MADAHLDEIVVTKLAFGMYVRMPGLEAAVLQVDGRLSAYGRNRFAVVSAPDVLVFN
jgi:hypothetical protein